MQKDFDGWNELKKDLDDRSDFLPVKEGEVWWCSIGINVGVETCGKNEKYSRPVVILKKLSQFGFLGVPLTSQEHTGSWYTEFVFKDKKQYAVLAQVRVFSTNRLTDRMGTLPQSDFDKIKGGFLELYK
ncbi:type II toxin-antitoxin system PemK/MazF family toxin [Candidatus Saccharibacteria bacterium]|nr:type II toxin-antitoxin system PemK/MazF family toxin [Candidatus Saccharibacteria bacterium]